MDRIKLLVSVITHSTHLLINGENPKLVQQRLGHEDVEITLRIYSHILPSMQRDAVNKLEQELNKRRELL